jgi:DNA-directed RNA polymerase specialized sigma24 family protein
MTLMAQRDQRDQSGQRALHVVAPDRYADWNAVYQDNATWVYRTIYARVGNRADAEDLTAEVFLAALRPLRISASIGEVRADLRATARTVLAAHWRATMGREITSIDDVAALPDRGGDQHRTTTRPPSSRRTARPVPLRPRAAVPARLYGARHRKRARGEPDQRKSLAAPCTSVGRAARRDGGRRGGR